jgi:hypothetical protein
MSGILWKFLLPGGQLGVISKVQVQKIIEFPPLPIILNLQKIINSKAPSKFP